MGNVLKFPGNKVREPDKSPPIDADRQRRFVDHVSTMSALSDETVAQDPDAVARFNRMKTLQTGSLASRGTVALLTRSKTEFVRGKESVIYESIGFDVSVRHTVPTDSSESGAPSKAVVRTYSVDEGKAEYLETPCKVDTEGRPLASAESDVGELALMLMNADDPGLAFTADREAEDDRRDTTFTQGHLRAVDELTARIFQEKGWAIATTQSA